MRKGTKSKNRRMTLGPVSDTRVNKVSDFASTLRNSAGPTLNLRQKKRASLSRQSANRRKSKERSRNSTSRTSASRTSASRNSQSRSSKGKSGRRQSSVHGYGGNAIVDPRPIKDHEFMNTEQRVLIGYLVEKNYDHQISPRTLTSPTTKDFENIASFLFRQIDSNFKFQLPQTVALPDDCSFFISDVCIPHSWYTVNDFNCNLYLRTFDGNGVQNDYILTLAKQSYNGATFATQLASKIQTATSIAPTVSYDVTKNTSANGTASFDFSEDYKDGQGGFAVLDIEVDGLFMGVINITEMSTTEKVIYLQ